MNLLSRFVALFREDDKASRLAAEGQLVFNRLVLEGRAVLDPELAKEYEHVYWAERTWGMSNAELKVYLLPRRFQIFDPYPDTEDSLH